MSGHLFAMADCAAVSGKLTGSADPFALYSAVSDQGTRGGTMLFEQAGGPTFILEQAALRAECRGSDVALTALSANGRNLLNLVAARMADRLVRSSEHEAIFRFPKDRSSDAGARLLAPSPFDVLRQLTLAIRQGPGGDPYAVVALGVIAFDHVDFLEELPKAAGDPLGFPDYLFWVAESLILFEPNSAPRAIAAAFGAGDSNSLERAHHDAVQRLSRLIERCRRISLEDQADLQPGDPNEAEVDLGDEDYVRLVLNLKERVAAGDVYQIVASRSFSLPCANPLRAYGMLRKLDRSPYKFFMASDAHTLFGASPETSVKIMGSDKRIVEVKPIAGTRGRGANHDEDCRIEAELRLDAKEQAEHMMLVDLARNDVARISEPGTRHVASLMEVERYAKVMHLVSRVRGTMKQGLDFTHALKSCLNMGTLTGAPKIRASQLLRHAEPTKRGPYGGTIGWISGSGAMDSAIVIRSAIVQDGIASVRAGAGIVHDSDPIAEADETRRKASALLSVLAGAAR